MAISAQISFLGDVADILERLEGFNGTVVGWCLMAFGGVGLIGNFLGGRAVDRHPLIASIVFSVFMVGGMTALIPSIHSPISLAIALVTWGITQAALFLICHVPVMKAAEGATAFGASLNISGANLGIGLGAIVGGRVMTSWGLESVGYAAACFIGLAIALAVVMMIRSAPQAVV